jgi:uracil-DNA glycosylase
VTSQRTGAGDPRARAWAALAGFWRDAGLDMPLTMPKPADAVVRGRKAEQGPGGEASAPRATSESIDAKLAEVLTGVSGNAGGQAAPKTPSKPSRAPADALSEARALAAEARTFEDLAAAITRFDGCALKESARRTVTHDGVVGAPVMVIGEAPGADEDRLGKPFVGVSGQLLDKMLAAIGLSRETNVLITNVIYWRPPGNRKPLDEEVDVCRPFMARMIELSAPKAILLVGGTAAETVLRQTSPISRLRGKSLGVTARDGVEPTPARAIFHPSYLLRRPQDKRLAWEDLQDFEDLLGSLGVDRGGRA